MASFKSFDRDLVGHELAFAGVFEKGHAYFCPRIDGTENIATGAVKKRGILPRVLSPVCLCRFRARQRG